MRGEKRKTGDAAACTIDNFSSKFLFCLLVANWRLGNFPHNFSRQILFTLAMATKMITAWSAV